MSDRMEDWLNGMSVEELWMLHTELTGILTRKIKLETAKLDERLSRISAARRLANISLERTPRPYPKVRPKYRNPKNPRETWSGRGKRPRWLAAQLRSGKALDHFLISRSS